MCSHLHLVCVLVSSGLLNFVNCRCCTVISHSPSSTPVTVHTWGLSAHACQCAGYAEALCYAELKFIRHILDVQLAQLLVLDQPSHHLTAQQRFCCSVILLQHSRACSSHHSSNISALYLHSSTLSRLCLHVPSSKTHPHRCFLFCCLFHFIFFPISISGRKRGITVT